MFGGLLSALKPSTMDPLVGALMQKQLGAGGMAGLGMGGGMQAPGGMPPGAPPASPQAGQAPQSGGNGIWAQMANRSRTNSNSSAPPVQPSGPMMGPSAGGGGMWGALARKAAGAFGAPPPPETMPGFPPQPEAKVPPAEERFNNAEALKGAYANNWSPNPMIMRMMMGMGNTKV